jgi:hypothetical protein
LRVLASTVDDGALPGKEPLPRGALVAAPLVGGRMSSGDDDDMTAEELGLLAADQAGRFLDVLPKLPDMQATSANDADFDLAACEEEDEVLRQRTAQALARLQADRDDLRSLLTETKRTEDDLDEWRGKRHALLQDGLREALAALGEASESEDDELRLRVAPGALVAGELSASEHAAISQARGPSWSIAAEAGSSNTDGGQPGAGTPASGPASETSLHELLAGDDARLEAHNSSTLSRPGSGRPGGAGARLAESRPSTAQQHRLAFEARGSLMASLAEKEAARQVCGSCASSSLVHRALHPTLPLSTCSHAQLALTPAAHAQRAAGRGSRRICARHDRGANARVGHGGGVG